MTSTFEPSTPPDIAFQRYLADGQIRLQQCGACARFIFFPRTLCPYCGRAELVWQPISGAGRVYSSTTVRQRPDRGGDYNVALIDLDEGVRMMSRVEGLPPQDVAIGMPVAGAIGEVDGVRAIVFRPGPTASPEILP